MNELDKKSTLSVWIQEYGSFVKRVALYYVKDNMLAEDITQEVFLKAYQNMEQFHGWSKIQTWLYRITSNHCKDYLKSLKYRMHVLGDFISRPETQESSENEFFKRVELKEIYEKVLLLPVKYREVITLYYFEGLKSREVAELLDVKESTIRARIQRGLSKLRSDWDGGFTHD